MRLSLLGLSLSFLAPLGVAGTDPTPPPDGFLIQEHTNVPYSWSDGSNVLMDVRYPVVAPGPCGWPLVVLVHGGGGSKEVVAGTAASLASRGYVTVGYDVRGQGSSAAANPPALMHDFSGLRELIDLFEAMEAVEALYPNEVDFDRIGVTGYSQGGRHAWWGAMHSGRIPPANPWRATAFPVVKAAVVKDNSAGQANLPDAFNASIVDKMFGTSDIEYEPTIEAALQAAVLAENHAAFNAIVTVPGMDPTVLLPQTTVPVFVHLSYDDKKVNPTGVFESFDMLPAATPKRIQMGTSGHDSPQNQQIVEMYRLNRLRWFDRFLKSIANGVDTGPDYRAAITPENTADYNDMTFLWDHRKHATMPAPALVVNRRYLSSGGNLTSSALGLASTSSVVHSVPAAFDMAAYTTILPNANQLPTIIPRSQVTYDSPMLTEDVHMEGIAQIELTIATLDPDYQVHAVLYDVAPSGLDRFVCRGGTVQRNAAGATSLSIQTYLQSYVFRRGHRIRLELTNLAIHEPPTGSAPYLKAVPYFSDSTVNVFEGGVNPSYIDLPILPFAAPTLGTYPLFQEVSAPQNQRLTIHSDSSYSTSPYLLMPTLSGTSPGTVVAGANVPINFDALTWALVGNPLLPPFAGFVGNIDPQGQAEAGILLGGLPLPAGLVGIEMSVAAIVAGAPNVATNAVTIPFVP